MRLHARTRMEPNQKKRMREKAAGGARLLRIALSACLVMASAAVGLWYGSRALEGRRGAKELRREWDLRALDNISIPREPPRTSFEPGEIVGGIIIPKMDLESPVVQMADADDRENLKKGPGHIMQTALCGQEGNCVVAGHRTTYSRPFFRLGELGAGDEIILVDLSGNRYRYEVNQVLVVAPTAVEVMDPTPEPSVTLIACHPPHSARSRLIVKGALVP